MDEKRNINLNDKLEITLKSNNPEEYDEISLREIIEVLIKGKKFIAWCIVIAVILALAGSVLVPKILSDSNGKIQTAITYRYDGASMGTNPYGGSLDINEIRSPAVLKPVIDEFELQEYAITTEDLRRNISFESLVPDRVVEKMSRLKDVKDDEFRIQQMEALSYRPNQFIVTLNLHKNLGIDETLGREVLDAVIRSYEGWFYTEYYDRAVLPNILADVNFDEYDYPEIVTIFNNQTDLMYSYLDEKIKEDPDFRSKETGLSFLELRQMVELVDNIELDRASSLVGAFNLTKDKDKLIKLYEYQIERYELTNKKKTDEMSIIDSMIDEYIKDTSAIIFSSASNAEAGISLDSEDAYYNSLVSDYASAGIEASDALNEIDFVRFKIDKLNEDETSLPIKQEALAEVDRLNEAVYSRLNKWIENINLSLQEYDKGRFFRSTLQQLTPSEVYFGDGVNLKLNLAIGLVLGLMIGVFAVFLRSYMNVEHKE